MAGDVYDGADRSLRAQLRFRDGLRRLTRPVIRAYVVHGNHDPLDGWAHSLRFPKDVHRFGPEVESVVFEKEGVPVRGSTVSAIRPRKSESVSAADSNEKATSRSRSGSSIATWRRHSIRSLRAAHRRRISQVRGRLLGTWPHSRLFRSREAGPFIGYPGNTQGRQINERGRRGCFLASVSADGKMECLPEFVPTDSRPLARQQSESPAWTASTRCCLLAEKTMDDLAQQAEGRPVVTRLEISGRGTLHHEFTRPNTTRDLLEELHGLGAARTPFVWVERLVLRTRPQFRPRCSARCPGLPR